MQWFRDRALTIVLMAAFVVFLAGQLMTGFYEYNATQREHGGERRCDLGLACGRERGRRPKADAEHRHRPVPLGKQRAGRSDDGAGVIGPQAKRGEALAH